MGQGSAVVCTRPGRGMEKGHSTITRTFKGCCVHSHVLDRFTKLAEIKIDYRVSPAVCWSAILSHAQNI